MMLIEDLVKKVNEGVYAFAKGIPSPATEDDISRIKKDFLTQFELELPEAYCTILKQSDGLLFNGLSLWPTKKYWLFRESLLDANNNLRNTFSNEYIYFALRDEELYVYNKQLKCYQAIEFVGQATWNEFIDAQEMLTFAITRALD